MVDEQLEEISSVVAVGMFEIDAPDFEQQVSTFLNCHLNQAHDAWVVPPTVDSIRRVSRAGFQHDSNLCQGMLHDDTASWPNEVVVQEFGSPPGSPSSEGVSVRQAD